MLRKCYELLQKCYGQDPGQGHEHGHGRAHQVYTRGSKLESCELRAGKPYTRVGQAASCELDDRSWKALYARKTSWIALGGVHLRKTCNKLAFNI